jgi:hypothetical protein
MMRVGCKHYRGLFDRTTCDAGVDFVALAGGREGMGARLPCLPSFRARAAERGNTVCVCPRYEERTAEEVAAEEAELAEMDARLMKLAPVWAEVKKTYRGRTVTVERDCPVCGVAGALVLRHSGYNGHIWTKCKTGCVSVME